MLPYKRLIQFAFVGACFTLSACSSLKMTMPGDPETPQLDAKFGDTVRAAKAAMIINPNAAKGANTAHALDANSANNSTEAYQKSLSIRPVISSEPQASGGGK